MNYSQLLNRAIALQSQIATKKQTLNDLKQTSANLINSLNDQRKTLSLFEQSLTTLQSIVNQLSSVQIDFLNNLLNQSLQTIFFDHNYSVNLNITDQRNTKNLEIIFLNDSIPTRVQDNGFRSSSNNPDLFYKFILSCIINNPLFSLWMNHSQIYLLSIYHIFKSYFLNYLLSTILYLF